MTTPAKTRSDRRPYQAPELIVPDEGMLDPEGKSYYNPTESFLTSGPS